MYYTKLDISIPRVDIVRERILDEYTPIGHRIRFYSIKNSEEFLNVLPQYVRDKFDVALLDATDKGLPCHIDDTTASINFYIDPGTFVTEFFKFKQPDDYKNFDTNGPYINNDNLELMDKFIAHPGDVYVLNTRQLHRVFNYTNNICNRLVAQLQTTYFTINDILELLHNVKTNS